RELPAGPVPLDALRREDIPPYELASAGGGDPRKAPPELVAILGDSRLKHWAPVRQVMFTPDNRLLASCGWDSTLRLWDTDTWNEVRTLTGHLGMVHNMTISADGTMLASAGADGTIRIWATATGKELHVLRGHRADTTVVAFRPDGKLLVSG